jgi:hypothetical protein
MANAMSTAGRVTGMFAGGVTAALWIAVIWFPVGGLMLEGISVAVGAFMAALGLIAAIASWHGHATVIFFCFVASFFGIGAFALNVDHWFRIFGVLDLLLLAASVMIWHSARKRNGRP